MRDHLLIFINGQRELVRGDDAICTLSDFLRKRRRLTGTKVVCAEGDCGSCAVLIGRPDASGQMAYSAVTSCIQMVFQLDGAHVVTVEGLRAARELNPIQSAMVACQGTQCGFCTPGFVVSLYDLFQQPGEVTPHAVKRGLVGNLCRCTGYDSIVRAAMETDRQQLVSLDALYPPAPIGRALASAKAEAVRIEIPQQEGAGHRNVYKPTTLADACRFRLDHPDCAVVAGATDLGVIHNKRVRRLDDVLVIGGLTELRGLSVTSSGPAEGNGHPAGRALRVGAGESLAALERAALTHLPELGAFLSWFGSPLIKNAGTLGGNLVTGSPIGDTLPALIVLEAVVRIAGVDRERAVPIRDFYTGYRKTVLQPGELVTGVDLPIPAADERLKLYKVSRRKDLDISTFSAAIRMRLQQGAISEIRIAYGGVGPTVLRMSDAEAYLQGRSPTLETFEEAGERAARQVTPITDVRGSEQYRRTLARNILIKFWHEVFGDSSSQPEASSRVLI